MVISIQTAVDHNLVSSVGQEIPRQAPVALVNLVEVSVDGKPPPLAPTAQMYTHHL